MRQVIVYPGEDGYWVAECPSLSGCISQERTKSEAIARHGSHMILRRDHPFSQVRVPDHKELDRGTLRSVIRQTQLKEEEFVNLL